MNRSLVSLALLTAGALSLQAEEGGAGHYVPGSLSTMIDMPPTSPGWVVQPIYLRYKGDASANRQLPIGTMLVGGLEAEIDAFTLGAFYTFDSPVLGAHYSVGALAPYVWADVTGSIEFPIGPPTIRRDRVDGIGDITLIPLMMAWEKDSWQFNALLSIYAPTGKYDSESLANPGLNYWMFDPTVGLAYNNETNGFNAALHTGFAFKTENPDTNYTSGTTWHVEASVEQLLPLGKGYLGIGVNAFYYDQISRDHGSGATLGGFEGRTFGVGPSLSYVLPMGDETFMAEIRWLPEIDTRNRLEGDFLSERIKCQTY